MKKIILFDFDGVLCNSTRHAYKMHNKLSKRFKMPKIHSSKDYFDVLDGENLYKFLDEDGKAEYNLNHRNLMFRNANKTKLYKGIDELFKISGLKFAIVSANYEKTVKQVFERNKVSTQNISYIYGRETEGNKKSKIEKILSELNINLEEAVYVGDCYSDIAVCEKLGLDIIVSDYGYSNTLQIASKKIVGRAKSVADLIKIINDLKIRGEGMGERFTCAVCVDLLMYRMEGDSKQVLLMRRKNTGDNDGEYELAGGHLEHGEDLFDAMIRESEEELLIKPAREDLEIVHLMHHYTGTRLNFIFKLDGSKFNPQIGEPEKCDKLEWFDVNNLPANISDKMRKIILNIEENKNYDMM